MDVLSELVELSNALGRPELDYVLLGEGNTSARADEETFWVKASGAELSTVTADGFVRLSLASILDLLNMPGLDDETVRVACDNAKVDRDAPGRPSVEALLHAVCLDLPGVRFVAHTHPTAVNSILCSTAFDQALLGSLFPDQIVVCGATPVCVTYTDPGVPLGCAVHSLVNEYVKEHGGPPRTIYLQNHGLIALGRTAREAAAITAMSTKAARVLVGTYAAGGPRFLSQPAVERIDGRPDEMYRRGRMQR